MRIGIDLGGTKIELIALDAAGVERLRFRRPTPADDYDATVSLIAEMVRYAERELHTTASIGIGTPGSVSLQTGRMKNCNSTCLNDRSLQQDIERLLGREIRTSNDANCFALSEAVDGAGAGCALMFGAILGTGVGGGIIVNGQVCNGANHIAGEWGHNPLPMGRDEFPGPVCYCGKCGCIETWLSGPALSADHKRITDQQLDAAAIATSKHSDCRQSMQRYCDRLARALAGVINVVDPDVIVLGGGLSNIDLLYEQVPQLWRAHVFSDVVRTRLLPPTHGDSSGVRGAAWLWGQG